MNKLNVLQLVPALNAGGVETGTVDLSRQLIAQGHNTIVISSGGRLVSDLEEMGAIHYELPIHEKFPWRYPALVKRILEIISSHEIDIIHARSRVPALLGFLAWRKAAKQVTFRLGKRTTMPVFLTTAHGFYSTHMFSRVMGWGRVVIANSERIARHMMDAFGVPTHRIQLILRGVNLDRFAYQAPRISADKEMWKVICVGRITPIKGHRDLIRAFDLVCQDFPRAKLYIVGKASNKHKAYEQELMALAKQLRLETRVEFTGHEDNVHERLKESDLLVLPSTGEEAFGRVLIEAGASGVPVVATRVGGIPEVIVHRETGLLVPSGEPIQLAAAIKALLQDREQATQMAQNNRKRVEERYSLKKMAGETIQVYQDTYKKMRILVMKITAIGDVVLVTPSLRALRERFPDAHITVLVGHQSRELLQRCPYIDDLIIFDRAREGTLKGLFKLGRKLRQAQVDMVVDFQNNRISHWLGRLSGAPQRYGYAGRRWSFLLTHKATHPPKPLPPVQHQFRLLQLLGIQSPDERLELWPGPSAQDWVDEFMAEAWMAKSQPLVVLHPGAQWPSKRWSVESFAALADRLGEETQARVVLTGTASEETLCEAIRETSQSKPIVAAGQTSLNELAALVSRAAVFVGGDTSALHVAASMGVPTLGLFGATAASRHQPPGEHVQVMQTKISCSPCYHRSCPRPGRGQMACMHRLTVEDVFEHILPFVKQAPVQEQALE